MHEHSRPCQAEVQQIITRAEAKALGLKRYFDGSPCGAGHISQRYSSTGRCCACARAQAIRWARENKDKLRAYRVKEYALNAKKEKERVREFRLQNKDYVRKCNVEWAANNPKRRKEINVAWADRNRDYLAAKQKAWRTENPEKAKEVSRNSRAKRRAALGSHTQKEVMYIIQAQRKKCAYCGVSLSLGYHIDHIVPLALGGSNYRHNLQALCPKCNGRKGAKHPVDYAREIGLLL